MSAPPPAPPPLDALEREICELAAQIAAATCQWLLLVAEFDRRGGWAEWGVKSCAHWLSWRCGIGLSAGREHVRVARALEGLPLIRASFAGGQLTYSKVRALSRVAQPETEADLLMIAEHATGAQLDRLVCGYTSAARASSVEAQRQQETQELRVDWQPDGTLTFNGRLSAENGALLLAALERAAVDVDDHLSRPQRRAEGLVALARGEAKPCELIVHVDSATLTEERIVERCEVEQGPSVAPETARRLGCDGSVVRILERDGEPLSIGRRTRVISPALQRALRSRDGGVCRFPGCTNCRWLHAHHIQHWAHGGPTSLSNLVQLCSQHHRLVHEGGYGVAVDEAGVLSFNRPDGTRIPDVWSAVRARGTTVQQRTRGLHIDDRTCFPKSAGDRLDYGHAIGSLLLTEQRCRGSG